MIKLKELVKKNKEIFEQIEENGDPITTEMLRIKLEQIESKARQRVIILLLLLNMAFSVILAIFL